MRLLSTVALAACLAMGSLTILMAPPVAHAQVTPKVSQQMQGEWKILLPPKEAMMAEAMRLIIRDTPPTEAELAALDAESREMAVLGRELVKTEPALADEARVAVQMADSMRMTVTADTLHLVAGPEQQIGKFVVERETDTAAFLVVTQEDGTSNSELRLVSPDKLEVYEGGQLVVQATRLLAAE